MSSSTPLTVDALYSAVRNNLCEKLHLDSSRSSFVLDTVQTLHDLVVTNSLEHRTGYRRLLLGRKGVGKSALLHELQSSVHDQLSKFGLLCMYVSYEDTEDVRLATHLARELHLPDAQECRIDKIENWLRDNRKSLFLVLDEFHLAYTSMYQEGKATVRDVMKMGSSRSGRIHCIISGSSTVMRRLYYVAAFDLNSTKFSARWIHSFLSAEDFCAASKIILGPKPALSDEEMAQVYLRTGGNARLMETTLRSPKSDTIALHSLSSTRLNGRFPVAKKILSAIFQYVSVQRMGDDPISRLDSVASCTKMVDSNTVMRHFGDDTAEYRALLFDLADAGIIHFDDVSLNLIGLGNAGIYVELIDQSALVLNVAEAFAMMVPVGDREGALAKDVTMRCLVQGAKSLFGINHSLKGTRELVLGTALSAADFASSLSSSSSASSPPPSASPSSPSRSYVSEPKSAVEYHAASNEKLLDYVWKESFKKSGSNSDKLGADAVIFQSVADVDGSMVMIAHRIQIKLGKGRAKKQEQVDDVEKTRFTTIQVDANAAYQRFCFGKPIQLKNYILSTCGLAHASVKEIEKPLEDAAIVYLNAKVLREKLWPASVLALGPPY